MLNLRTSDNQKIACREWKGNHRCYCYCSVPKSCLTLWDPVDCSTPDFPVLHYLLEFAQIHVHWVSDANLLILSCPILLLPSVFPRIRVFSNESGLHIRWPKYWSFSFNISPSNEHSGLISFRMDWLDLLAVQGIFFNTRAEVLDMKVREPSDELSFSCHLTQTAWETPAESRLTALTTSRTAWENKNSSLWCSNK